jgi:hypothetical protein
VNAAERDGDGPPPEPALLYDPRTGSRRAFEEATREWAAYWRRTPHGFSAAGRGARCARCGDRRPSAAHFES